MGNSYIGLKTPSPETLESSYRDAFEDLHRWVTQKMSGLDKQSPVAMLGPTFDHGTYYYRMGYPANMAVNGWGMNTDQLNKHLASLKRMGLPEVNGNELDAVNQQFYKSLRGLYPDRKMVIKHYPGGDEQIEASEQQPVDFRSRDPKQVAGWIKAFDPILQDPHQPFGVMLSHATYNLDAFPGIDKMHEPDIPDYITNAVRKAYGFPETAARREVFSAVPASMNPYVTQYLREVKGYKGVITGDWYNMKSAEQFCSKLIPYLAQDLTGGAMPPSIWQVSYLMGVVSGVNYMRGNPVYNDSEPFWEEFSKFRPDLLEKLKNRQQILAEETYNIVKAPADPPRKPATVIRRDAPNDPRNADNIEATFLSNAELISPPVASEPGLYYSNKPQYKERLATAEKFSYQQEMFKAINVETQVVQNDIWNNTGVLTMQFRKSVVERVTGKKFADAPMDTKKEGAWFNGLMNNAKFKKAYDAIDWQKLSSPQSTEEQQAKKMPQSVMQPN